MLEQKSEHLQFIGTIEQALGHPLSPRLWQAFLAVSRVHFVPSYYVQEQPGEWHKRDTGDVVYQDKALITKVNERGHPCSSSSMPSIMAAMLRALNVPPECRVLEIGTGTGYNAALLAEMVGPNGQVVSIDIDNELVERASARLREAGYSRVQVRTANGLEGYASASPYDRIIVTGGFPSIPPAWIDQLAIGGILVGNLLSSMATPLFRLVKGADGLVTGTLLTTPAFFMSLSSGSPSRLPQVNFAQFEALPSIEQAQTMHDMVKMIYDPSFALFVESSFPGIERHLRYLGGSPKNIGTCLIWKNTLLTLSPLNKEEGTSASQWSVEVRGQIPLWSMIQSLHEQWIGQGKPSLDRYKLDVYAKGNYRIFLPNQHKPE